MIIWLTGQPESGKTTLATKLAHKIPFFKLAGFIDGDVLREKYNNYDYSEDGRKKNMALAQSLASQADSPNKVILVAMVSPYRDQREIFKSFNDVKEIYLHSDRESPHKVSNYEPPLKNYLVLDTSKLTEDECLEKIREFCSLSWEEPLQFV